MNLNNLSAKKICRLVSAGMVFSMLVITGIFGGIMQDIRIFIVGGTLTLCAFFWIWLLVLIFGKRLSHVTSISIASSSEMPSSSGLRITTTLVPFSRAASTFS